MIIDTETNDVILCLPYKTTFTETSTASTMHICMNQIWFKGDSKSGKCNAWLTWHRISGIKGYKDGYKIDPNPVGTSFEYYINDLLTRSLYNSAK